MYSVISKAKCLWRDRRGTTAMEFALIAIPFTFIMIATTDLGRYWLTQHSLRTLTAEAARSTMVNCFGQSSCSLNATQRSAVETATPFLIPGSVTLTASQTVNGAGLRTITVTAVYPFNFIFVAWTGLNGNITETTSVSY